MYTYILSYDRIDSNRKKQAWLHFSSKQAMMHQPLKILTFYDVIGMKYSSQERERLHRERVGDVACSNFQCKTKKYNLRKTYRASLLPKVREVNIFISSLISP